LKFMSIRSKWDRLPTEAINPRSRDIDALPLDQMVETMILDHRSVLAAVQREKSRIARGARIVADALLSGGRLIFVGAGTSGRLGVLEAAELPPTFGIEPHTALGIMAGGLRAVYRAREGVEDDYDEGARAIARLRLRSRDVVVGISASGITPIVRGAVTEASRLRAQVIGVTCDPKSALKQLAAVTIVLPVGPEVIAGSTRLKAGTATKMVLNMLTTTAMVRAGKTYGNLMVDVKSTSAKLRDRARRILHSVIDVEGPAAEHLLDDAGWNVKAAILMHEKRLTRTQARARLRLEPRLRKHLGRR